MISNLQVLRGLAALAVVFYHTAFVIPGLQHTDFQAVCVFFVISGFIMTYITRETAEGFLAHRLIRILPLYWIATVFYVAWTRGGFSSVLGDPSMIYRGPGHFLTTNQASLIYETAQSLLFVPRFDDAGTVVFPVLGVGWTLNLEMYFYVLFSAALLISRRFAPLLVAATLWAISEYSGRLGCNAYCSFYAHGYVTFFIYGIAVFYAWRMLAPLLARGVARYFTIAGSVGVIGCFIYLTTLGFDGHLTQYHMAAPPALVLALLLLHSAGGCIVCALFDALCRHRNAASGHRLRDERSGVGGRPGLVRGLCSLRPPDGRATASSSTSQSPGRTPPKSPYGRARIRQFAVSIGGTIE
jgi:exopolysaccharide production protein ExoZ